MEVALLDARGDVNGEDIQLFRGDLGFVPRLGDGIFLSRGDEERPGAWVVTGVSLLLVLDEDGDLETRRGKDGVVAMVMLRPRQGGELDGSADAYLETLGIEPLRVVEDEDGE